MEPAVGPVLPKPVATPADIDALNFTPNCDTFFKYLYDAITLTRKRLSAEPDLRAVPLIGFCGAPWTLMAYMIEGGGSKGHDKSRAWFYQVRAAAAALLGWPAACEPYAMYGLHLPPLTCHPI